jgi:hypothetical protein
MVADFFTRFGELSEKAENQDSLMHFARALNSQVFECYLNVDTGSSLSHFGAGAVNAAYRGSLQIVILNMCWQSAPFACDI